MTTNLIAYNITGLGPTIPDNEKGGAVALLDSTLSTIIGVLTLIAFIFFVLQVIFAGYSFLSSQGDEKKIETARKRLTDGVLGITIVVVAFGLGALIARILGLGNIFDLATIFSKFN